MIAKTIIQKKSSIEANRGKNYRASLRLEGFTNIDTLHGSTKAEVIAYYKKATRK